MEDSSFVTLFTSLCYLINSLEDITYILPIYVSVQPYKLKQTDINFNYSCNIASLSSYFT